MIVVLPLGHIGFTWGALNVLQHAGCFKDADYRGVALAALASDLIDKPLAVFAFPGGKATLLFAHTALAQILVWTAVWRKGRAWLPFGLAFSGHLVADRMWGFLQTLLWPWRGLRFHQWRDVGSLRAFGAAYVDIVRTEPKLIFFELVGFGLLAWLAIDRRLYHGERLRQFVGRECSAKPGDI